MANRYAPIEDYGIIGDLHTVALVGKNASIDFLCVPSFDSPSVFAALLDAERGVRFQIAPKLDEAVHKQIYLPDTNVQLTRFLSDGGVAEAPDFMPVEDAGVAHTVVRRAKTVRGEVSFGMRCDPPFDYDRATHTAERRGDTEVLIVGSAGRTSWCCDCARRCRWSSRTEVPWLSSRLTPMSPRGSCWRS
jgi:GH15 family glucan-1,4-alpha-glucosidase